MIKNNENFENFRKQYKKIQFCFENLNWIHPLKEIYNWSLIFPDTQLPKVINNQLMCFPKWWNNNENFEIFRKISGNRTQFLNSELNTSMKSINNEISMLVLLYEFPAETRLTVYRRLDIRKQWLSRADLGPHKMMNHWKSWSSYQCFARWHDGKCTEKLVKCIWKINMNVIKCENRNATTRLMISQNYEKFRKKGWEF